MQQLHRFDEVRNDQEIIRNRIAKQLHNVFITLFVHISFMFSIYSSSKNNQANEKWKKCAFWSIGWRWKPPSGGFSL
jgi:hypothetical protein